jgi:peptidoglycan/xylan/chitin deacetylase (PgdA/CDA1 family)
MNRKLFRKYQFLPVLAGGLMLVLGPRCQASQPDVLAQELPQPFPDEGKKIAFVFEDGPLPHTTPLLLDALKNLGMKATFAVTGENVESNPGLARRIVAEGHELANHTYSLPDLKRLSQGDIVREIHAAEEAIMRVTGVKPGYFRATNGELSESLRDVVQKEGYEVLDSTLDSGDWRNPSSEKLMRTILGGVKPDSVILAHDSFPKTVREMPAVFNALVKRGFLLCTASELHPPSSHRDIPISVQPSKPTQITSINGTCTFGGKKSTWSAKLTADGDGTYDAVYVSSWGGATLNYVGTITTDLKTEISGNGKAGGGKANGTFEFTGKFGDDGIAHCSYKEVNGGRSGSMTAEIPK